MASTHLTIEIRRFPEALQLMQRKLADAIRDRADAESDPRVARALREVAAEFETVDTTSEME